MAAANLGNLSERVWDSELPDAECHKRYGIHHRLAENRGKGSQETWVHVRNLGKGGQGTVELQKNDQSGTPQFRAVKHIRLSRDRSKNENRSCTRELETIFKFSQAKYSPFFVRSYGWYSSLNHIHIVMEYCELGDLRRYLEDDTRCPNHRLPEAEVREIASQVLKALHWMHEEGFAHRDIKPANILIESHPRKHHCWSVKLGDFGISKQSTHDGRTSTIKGTRIFMAPELLDFYGGLNIYDGCLADMWSLGVTLFLALTGRNAFLDVYDLSQYCHGSIGFPGSVLATLGVSNEAINFLRSILQAKPEYRVNADGALKHGWMCTNTSYFWTDTGARLRTFFKRNKTSRPLQTGQHITDASASWSTISQRPDKALSGYSALNAAPSSAAPFTTHSLGLDDIIEGLDYSSQTKQACTKSPGLRRGVRSAADIRLGRIAETQFREGHFAKAGIIYQHLVRLRMQTFGARNAKTLNAIQNFADTLFAQGRLEEARELYQQTVEIKCAVFGAQSKTALQSMRSLAMTLYELGYHSSVEEVAQKVANLENQQNRQTRQHGAPSVNSVPGRGLAKILGNGSCKKFFVDSCCMSLVLFCLLWWCSSMGWTGSSLLGGVSLLESL